MSAAASLTGAAAIGRALDNISASTVNRLIKDGLIKAYKLPGRGRNTPWRVRRDEIERFRREMHANG